MRETRGVDRLDSPSFLASPVSLVQHDSPRGHAAPCGGKKSCVIFCENIPLLYGLMEDRRMRETLHA